MVIPTWPEWPEPPRSAQLKEAVHADGRLAARKIAVESENAQRTTEQSARRVGTLCLGVADADGTATRTLTAPGDRTQVRLWTATVALDLVRRRLEGLA